MARSNAVKVESVQFARSKHDLKALLLQWNVLRGVDIEITANDYVGGSFDVTFSRSGDKVDRREADAWVAAALRHASDQ